MILDTEKINELTIIHYPHPVLKQQSKRIEQIDDNIEKLILKMLELMYQNKGVGLAANQVAVPLSLFVANPTGEKQDELIFINPEIIEQEGWDEAEEGCLSVPQIYTKIRRRKKIVAQAIDITGKQFEIAADNLLARIIQHETDHLLGKTIVDRMSPLAKISNRRQLKLLEEQFNAK